MTKKNLILLFSMAAFFYACNPSKNDETEDTKKETEAEISSLIAPVQRPIYSS